MNRVNRGVGVVLLIATSTVGCSNSKAASANSQLEECLSGWWQDAEPGGGCFCSVGTDCGPDNCNGYHVIGLLPSNTYFSAYVSVSRSARSVTTRGVSRGTFSVMNGQIQVHATSDPAFNKVISCDGNQMKLGGGQTVLTRARPDLTSALDRIASQATSTVLEVPL